MKIAGIYFGAGIGATALEIQIYKLVIRILRPRHYFWPYKKQKWDRITWPNYVKLTIHPEQ
jgi:hypothetical protein